MPRLALAAEAAAQQIFALHHCARNLLLTDISALEAAIMHTPLSHCIEKPAGYHARGCTCALQKWAVLVMIMT